MNLKLVVASMSVLGVISGSAFAADTTAHPTKTHKVHRRHHVKTVKHTTVAQQDYKDMGSLPVQPAPVDACTISQSSMVLDAVTQNMGRALPNPCKPNWQNRIMISGGMNFDLGKWGNRNANITGENYQRLSINDAYINVAANVNDWARAFASLSYSNPTTNTVTTAANQYSSVYNTTNLLNLEQAYVTLGNFDVSPLFLQVGKGFQDFSRYNIHPITRSMTQVMSEVLATSVKLGFVANGFNGSIYAFDDTIAKINQTSKPTNYGVSLGYEQPSDQLGWGVGAAYLYNMISAQDVADHVDAFTLGNGYNSRVGAVALYANVNSGPFRFDATYTAAVQRFNALDLPKNGVADYVNLGANGNTPYSGAKPWAAGIKAGFGFDNWGKEQVVYVGYQTSRDAAGLGLPRHRWLGGYDVKWMDAVSFGVRWDHDKAYSVARGGNGRTTNLVSLRSEVQFS